MKAWIVALCTLATGITFSTAAAAAMDRKQEPIKCPATWLEGGGSRLIRSFMWLEGPNSPVGDDRSGETETVEEGTVTTIASDPGELVLLCHYANGRRLVVEPQRDALNCETLERTAPHHNEPKTEAYCEYLSGSYPSSEPIKTYVTEPLTRHTVFWASNFSLREEHVNSSGKIEDINGVEHGPHDSWTTKYVIKYDPMGEPPDLPIGTTLIFTFKTGGLVGISFQPPRSTGPDGQYIDLIHLLGDPDHGTWRDPIQSWDGADGIKLTVRNFSMRGGTWVYDPKFFVYDSRRMKDILQPKPR